MTSLCTAMKSRRCSLQLDKALTQQWSPSTAKNKQMKRKKRIEGVGDSGSTHCHDQQPNTSGSLMQHEQACAKGRKFLLWCLLGEWEMGWTVIQVGPMNLWGHGIQRLLTCGLVMTDAESWGDLAWLRITRQPVQLTVSLGKWWEVCAGSLGSQLKLSLQRGHFFFFFGERVCGILVPQPGIKPVLPVETQES